MALEFVGGDVGEASAADITLTLPGGVATDDVVYIGVMRAGPTDLDLGMATEGYSELIELFADDNADTNFAVYRKIMGATPDSEAVVDYLGGGSTWMEAAFHCWSGADTTTPEDVTPTSATGTDGGTPNNPSIDTASANAVVLAIAGSSEADAVTNAPSGYSNLFDIQGTNANVMISSKLVVSPATEDPGTYADISGNSNDSWAAYTVAIRPAGGGAPNTRRYTLTMTGVG